MEIQISVVSLLQPQKFEDVIVEVTILDVKACMGNIPWREGESLVVAFLISSLYYLFITKSYWQS